MTEEEFNKQITHGIIAITPDMRVIHFIGFIGPPNPADYILVQEELETDAEFKIEEKFVLAPCPMNLIPEFREAFQDPNNKTRLDDVKAMAKSRH